MGTIAAGVALSLNDRFSSGLAKAGQATTRFGSTLQSMSSWADRSLGRINTALADMGISIGMAGAAKEVVNLQARLERLGTTLDIPRDKVAELKTAIFETATAPDIKMDMSAILTALEAIGESGGSAAYAYDNIRSIGLALQATGASGQDIGSLFAEFDKAGLSADASRRAIEALAVQTTTGEYKFAQWGKSGGRLLSIYSVTGRSGEAAIRELGAAMQVLTDGTGNAEKGTKAFEAIMAAITDPDKERRLRSMGVNIRDQQGSYKAITDIITDLVTQSKGNVNAFGAIFEPATVVAFNAAAKEFKDTGAIQSIKRYQSVVADGSALQEKAARNAQTAAGNLANLKNAFAAFADSSLTKPLEALTAVLNRFAENPQRLQTVFKVLAGGMGIVLAIKGASQVAGIVSSVSRAFGKTSTPSAAMGVGGAGGAGATPVFVTNWNDASLGAGTAKSASVRAAGKMTMSQGAQIAGASALSAALVAIPAMISELSAIKNTSELSGKQKTKAQGGAIGDAVGKIGGAAAGALAGAAIGSIIPGVGTVIGGLIGGGIGMFGGWLGRKAGEKIGEAVGRDESVPVSAASKAELMRVSQLPATPATAKLEGNAVMDINVNLTGDRPTADAQLRANSTPFKYTTGNSRLLRGLSY